MKHLTSKLLTLITFTAVLALQCNAHTETEESTIQISAGFQHTCILVKGQVNCWGSNEEGHTQVPALKNPKMVSAGGSHTCALDDEGVKCWGSNDYNQTKVPALKNPKMVSAGEDHACALDDEGDRKSTRLNSSHT